MSNCVEDAELKANGTERITKTEERSRKRRPEAFGSRGYLSRTSVMTVVVILVAEYTFKVRLCHERATLPRFARAFVPCRKKT